MSKTNPSLDFSGLSDEQIQACLAENALSLTVSEAKSIQHDILQRPPTLAECILWSIEGSEHCSYKSSRNHLKQLPTSAPNVILGPSEDAGVIHLASDKQGQRYGLVLSHESHNHPSQIVPFEGAATGVGGNVRDVNCMGAEVIAVADGLRFGDINEAKTHWLNQGVVAGISNYGNSLGIANLAGDVYYHPGYNDNCLVTVVTLGILREDEIIHSYAPDNADGYDLILVGKPTDQSGFGGASFASLELEEEDKEANRGAVQEPNAFLERHLLKANYALFKILNAKNLLNKVGFKDLGAGGIACASVELADGNGFGAEVYLEKVPTGMPGLNPAVILCAETQERFMWVVPPEVSDLVIEHYNETFALPKVSAGAKASIVGKVRADGQYRVHYHDELLVDAKAELVTKGIVYDRPFTAPEQVKLTDNIDRQDQDLKTTLLTLLAHENIASRQAIFESYDKQVQGRTIVESGQADAGVMQPFNSNDYPEEIRQVGVALSLDQNPNLCAQDPYWGAVNAVVESVRNVTATGASPQAITDCLCFANPEKPEQMWELVEAIRGIKDACEAIGLLEYPDSPLPVVAGNVSLYNETKTNKIPASPMISCVGRLADVAKVVTMPFKKTDSDLILIGARSSATLPKPDVKQVRAEVNLINQLAEQQLLLACHDISDGGLAIALAEMSFVNAIGVKLALDNLCNKDFNELTAHQILFGEDGGFILEVDKAHTDSVISLASELTVPLYFLGQTQADPKLDFAADCEVDVSVAKNIWQNALRDKLRHKVT